MPGISWYTEFRGAAGFWIAALVFALVGAVFTAIGVLAEEFFLFIGLPFLGLGLLVLALMIYSLHLKVRHPEKYSRWLWWVNFVGGLFGALLFAIPSTFVLPFLLLADGGSEFIWLGALFTIIGVLTTATIVVIAVRQYRDHIEKDFEINKKDSANSGGKYEFNNLYEAGTRHRDPLPGAQWRYRPGGYPVRGQPL